MKQAGPAVTSRRRPAAPANSSRVYHVQVLDRALAILDVLSGQEAELGAGVVAERLKLHKSTVHRLLAVLEQHGYVQKNPKNGRHYLGRKLLELGSRAMAKQESWEHARPFLERLVAETGETAHLGVLRGREIISMVNADSPHTLRMPATVGRGNPLHCTSLGKAVLAFLPREQVDELIPEHGLRAYTPRTITSRAAFRTELERVRRRGYAVDDEEIEEALKCIGAPIRDCSGNVIAAISIAGPASRMKQDAMPRLIRSVTTAAAQLSAEMGFRESPPVVKGARRRSTSVGI